MQNDQNASSSRHPIPPAVKKYQHSNARISIACFSCRRRRSKCDGARPRCGKCIAIDTECEYADHRRSRLKELEEKFREIGGEADFAESSSLSLSTGGSVSQSVHRNTASVSESGHRDDDKSTLLLQLFNLIRYGQEGEVDALIDRIRHSNSWKDVEPLVRQQFQLTRSIKTLTCLQPSAMLAKTICNEPRFHVPAAPWTTVTKDNLLVSHLISLYFTWEHPFCSFIDPALFVRDMAAGSSRFCSKALVNALLAQSCFYAYSFDESWDRTVEKTLMTRFQEEALNCLDQESNEPSLTRLQATLIMNVLFNCIGKDRIGSGYLQSARQMVEDPAFHVYRAKSQAASKVIEVTEWNRVFMTTLSGFMYWRSLVMHFMRRYIPLSYTPLVESAMSSELVAAEIWTPYPFNGPSRNSYPIAFADAQARLSRIVDRIARLIYENRTGSYEKSAIASGMLQELNQWHSQLDSRFDVAINASPQNFMLQLYYQNLTVSLWEVAHSKEEAKSVLLSAKTTQRDLLELYRNLHGWTPSCVILLHWLLVGALNAVSMLNDPTTSDGNWVDSLASCIDGIWNVSYAVPLGRLFLRCLQRRLGSCPAVFDLVSHKSKIALDRFEDEVWDTQDLSQVESNYPINFGPSGVEGDGTGIQADQFVTMEQLLRPFDHHGL